MDQTQLEMMYLLAGVILELASAVWYLTVAVVTLAVVGLIGYLIAIRKART